MVLIQYILFQMVVKLQKQLKDLELSVSFSEYLDETSSICNFVCPDHNYLESWCDLNPWVTIILFSNL